MEDERGGRSIKREEMGIWGEVCCEVGMISEGVTVGARGTEAADAVATNGDITTTAGARGEETGAARAE